VLHSLLFCVSGRLPQSVAAEAVAAAAPPFYDDPPQRRQPPLAVVPTLLWKSSAAPNGTKSDPTLSADKCVATACDHCCCCV
jgi:hypothetical protein